MRETLYILGLMGAIFLLALDFPTGAVGIAPQTRVRPPFASYVELSSEAHAACLEAAKTSWQVRSGSRGRPVIGSLDSGVPLLMDSLPSPEKVVFRGCDVTDSPVGPAEIDVYSLMPGTEGVDSPSFKVRPQGGDGAKAGERKAAFPRADMLSIKDFEKLKEIMQ